MATNFPHGIASYGMPVIGDFGGLPGAGNVFFVDPVNGLDGNIGTNALQAFKTINEAYTHLTANQNDTVILLGSPTAGAVLSAQLVWAKNQCHLIGVGAPSRLNMRPRLSFTANFSPGVLVSASSCLFRNLYIPYGRGNAANLIAWQDTGARNVYDNCHWLIGNATEAAQATFILLNLVGATESYFTHCTIGGTTITRAAANTLLGISGGAGRFTFDDCLFLSEIAALTTPTMVAVGAGVNDLQEFGMFRRCSFLNYSINQAAKLAQAISGGQAAGGVLMIDQCGFVGATAVTTTNVAQVWIIGAEPVTAANQGRAVNP